MNTVPYKKILFFTILLIAIPLLTFGVSKEANVEVVDNTLHKSCPVGSEVFCYTTYKITATSGKIRIKSDKLFFKYRTLEDKRLLDSQNGLSNVNVLTNETGSWGDYRNKNRFINVGEEFYINVTGQKNDYIGVDNILFLEINGVFINWSEYAWWNVSFADGVNISLLAPDTDKFEVINVSYVNMSLEGKDLRLVNQSCYDDGDEVNLSLVVNSTVDNHAKIFFINHDNSSDYCLYSNNPKVEKSVLLRQFFFYEDGDGGLVGSNVSTPDLLYFETQNPFNLEYNSSFTVSDGSSVAHIKTGIGSVGANITSIDELSGNITFSYDVMWNDTVNLGAGGVSLMSDSWPRNETFVNHALICGVSKFEVSSIIEYQHGAQCTNRTTLFSEGCVDGGFCHVRFDIDIDAGSYDLYLSNKTDSASALGVEFANEVDKNITGLFFSSYNGVANFVGYYDNFILTNRTIVNTVNTTVSTQQNLTFVSSSNVTLNEPFDDLTNNSLLIVDFTYFSDDTQSASNVSLFVDGSHESSVDGFSIPANESFNLSFLPSSQGSINYFVRAVGENDTVDSVSQNYVYDTVAPLINWSYPDANFTTTNNSLLVELNSTDLHLGSVNVSVFDNESGLFFSSVVSSENETFLNITANVSFTDSGNFSINATAFDRLNSSVNNSFVDGGFFYYFDDTKPTVFNGSLSSSSPTAGEVVVIKAYATDDLLVKNVRVSIIDENNAALAGSPFLMSEGNNLQYNVSVVTSAVGTFSVQNFTVVDELNFNFSDSNLSYTVSSENGGGGGGGGGGGSGTPSLPAGVARNETFSFLTERTSDNLVLFLKPNSVRAQGFLLKNTGTRNHSYTGSCEGEVCGYVTSLPVFELSVERSVEFDLNVSIPDSVELGSVLSGKLFYENDFGVVNEIPVEVRVRGFSALLIKYFSSFTGSTDVNFGSGVFLVPNFLLIIIFELLFFGVSLLFPPSPNRELYTVVSMGLLFLLLLVILA